MTKTSANPKYRLPFKAPEHLSVGDLSQRFKAEVAKKVAESVLVPVIGIGAGKDVDGQVLVFSDMLGLFEEFTPKFVKKYIDGATLVRNAVSSYAQEVQSREFPKEEHTY